MKTFFILFLVFLSGICFSQSTITFQKKKKLNREVEVKLPLYTALRLKDGKRLNGYVFAVKDSTLRMACFHKPTRKAQDSLNKLFMRDKLNMEQRANKANQLYYPDTTEILFSKTKYLNVPLGARKHGVIKTVGLSLAFATSVYLSWGLMQNNLTNDNNVRKVSPFILYGDMFALATGLWFTANKSFRPEKWQLKK